MSTSANRVVHLSSPMVEYSIPTVDWSTLSVQELLKCCVDSNDPAAWEEFVRRFQGVVWGNIRRCLRAVGAFDYSQAEDLTQDAFLRLCTDRFRVLRQFQAVDGDCFYGLLRATAISTVRDHFRRTRSIKRRMNLIAEPIERLTHDQTFSTDEEKKLIDNLLIMQIDRALNSDQRASCIRNRFIFWLHHRDGFSAREISQLPSVDLSERGVETVLNRMMDDLTRKRFGEPPTKENGGGADGI